jgi:hypothetical protein
VARSDRYYWRIETFDDFPSLVAKKDQYAVDLKRCNSMDQANEHENAGDDQAGNDEDAYELNSTRISSIYPGKCSKCINKSSNEDAESVRYDGIASDPDYQSG